MSNLPANIFGNQTGFFGPGNAQYEDYQRQKNAEYSRALHSQQMAATYDPYSCRNAILRDRLDAYNTPQKPIAKLGKITPKPGYIRDHSHPDGVRAKVITDYTYLEQALIWLAN